MKYPKRMLQECPLCGTEHPIYIKGMIKDLEDQDKAHISHDKGYSFCNCKNIYFTKWENMEQEIYDEEYVEKYDNSAEILKKYSKTYFPELKRLNPNISRFLEIGCINDAILEEAEKEGWNPVAFDIVARESKYSMIVGDIERGIGTRAKYDVIWASHIIEHLRDPIKAIKALRRHLNANGLLFVAMPDPFFIDHKNVYTWQHWWVKEHHILWDMESFVEEVEKIGFKCELQERNINPEFICNGDFHLIFKCER